MARPSTYVGATHFADCGCHQSVEIDVDSGALNEYRARGCMQLGHTDVEA